MTKAIRQDRIFIFLCPIIAAIFSYFVFKGLFGKYNIIISSTDGLDDCKLMLDIWGDTTWFSDYSSIVIPNNRWWKIYEYIKVIWAFYNGIVFLCDLLYTPFLCSHICADSYFYKNMEYDGIYNIVCSSGWYIDYRSNMFVFLILHSD